MATILNIDYRPTKKPLEEQARDILEKRGTWEAVIVRSPELLREIERISCDEIGCRLRILSGETEISYGYGIDWDAIRAAESLAE
jgi:hypothetical protein